MRHISFGILFLLTIASCTKEVPETEKKLLKSSGEKSAEETIKNFAAAYNDNNIEKAVSFFDNNYKGAVGDSDYMTGLDSLREDLMQYRKQYPEGRWEINIDETIIAGDYACVLTTGSFLMPDPIEKKMNPVYSERAMRILKKQKSEEWKIYRSLATPTFTYDQK